MTDPVALANALKAVALAMTDGGGAALIKGGWLGLNVIPTDTPAVEVLLGDGRIDRETAGGQGSYLEQHRFEVVFIVPLTPNSDDDETAIGTLIKAFVDTIHDPAFDATLGGLTEATRCISYDTQVIRRNNRPFRAGAVGIETGEL